MNNGSKADLSDATIEYVIDNNEIATIEDGKLVGLTNGVTAITANVTSNGNTISSNTVTIKVGEVENEIPPVVEVDKSGLQAVVDKVDTLIESDYTQESWANLIVALEAANSVLADKEATEEEVKTATTNLEAAIKSLEEKEENAFKAHLEIAVEEALKVTEAELSNVVPVVVEEFKAAIAEAQDILNNNKATQAEVEKSFDRLAKAMQMLSFQKGDKTNLISLIERIEALDSSKYIASTWDKLAIALEASNGVVADENAMEAEIVESYETLLKSFLELRLKPNKDALNDLINKAESLDSSKYTEESFNAVKKALEEANAVFANEDATIEEIEVAEENLRKAMNSLQANSGSGNNNSGNSGSTNNSGNNGNSSNSGKLPQTGGTPAVAVGLFGTILAGIGAVFSRKKK